MKRKFALGVAIAMALTGSAFAQEVGVKLNGINIPFEDTKPMILNDRTFVPLRNIAESLGADINWNEGKQTVTLKKDENEVSFVIGEKGSMVEQDRTFVPLRFIAENLGVGVEWNEAEQTVLLNAVCKDCQLQKPSVEKENEEKKEDVKKEEKKEEVKEEKKVETPQRSYKTLQEAGITSLGHIDDLRSVDGKTYDKVYEIKKGEFPIGFDGIVITNIQKGKCPYKKTGILLINGYVKGDRKEAVELSTFGMGVIDKYNNFRLRAALGSDVTAFQQYKNLYPNMPIKMVQDFNKGMVDTSAKQGESFTYVIDIQDDADELIGLQDYAKFGLKDVKKILLYNCIDGTELFLIDETALN